MLKKWKLNDGRTMPSSVTAALLKDGVEQEAVELNARNGWAHTWNDLNKDNVWTVQEKNILAGFISSVSHVSQNGFITFTITNDDVPTAPTPTPMPMPMPDRVPQTNDISHVQILYLLSFIFLLLGVSFFIRYKTKKGDMK